MPTKVCSFPVRGLRSEPVTEKLLLIDDDKDMRELLTSALRSFSYAVEAVESGAAALARLQTEHFSAVISDVNLAGMSGIELCTTLSAKWPELPVIIITGHGSMDVAIAAIRAGAYDFITKPILMDALRIAVQRVVERQALRSEVRRLREVVSSSQHLDGMVGESPVMRRVYELIERVAISDASVLITGETGTGKELVARSLHDRSPRKNAPFVAVNCAALPMTLLESELFGHVRGAFTDARQSRTGLFVQASGGTLFLDEIGEMPLEVQAKLLRALQERKVRPVGGDTEVSFDARLISATSQDLDTAVEEKRFRRDLHYRINAVIISTPPLRSRGNDILLLAQHFLKKQAARQDKGVVNIGAAVVRKLLDYDWPGNVRELENCMERAVALAALSELCVDDLPDTVRQHQSTHLVIDTTNPEELLPLVEMERRYVRRVLAAVMGNKTRAAKVLGLDRRSFYRRLARLDRKPAA
jgi:two-component system response regulator AtoC